MHFLERPTDVREGVQEILFRLTNITQSFENNKKGHALLTIRPNAGMDGTLPIVQATGAWHTDPTRITSRVEGTLDVNRERGGYVV